MEILEILFLYTVSIIGIDLLYNSYKYLYWKIEDRDVKAFPYLVYGIIEIVFISIILVVLNL